VGARRAKAPWRGGWGERDFGAGMMRNFGDWKGEGF